VAETALGILLVATIVVGCGVLGWYAARGTNRLRVAITFIAAVVIGMVVFGVLPYFLGWYVAKRQQGDLAPGV